MKSFLANAWVQRLLRWGMGAFFAYAGWIKIENPQAFADSIATFQALPLPLINLMALGLPFFELLLGLGLFSGWRKQEVLFCVVVLCSVFALALIQALVRGLQIDCGCFGSGPPTTEKAWIALGRDIVLLGVALSLYWQMIMRETLFRAREG